MTIGYNLTDRQDDQVEEIGRKLARYNNAAVGTSGRLVLAVLARDAEERVVGGLSGYTAWGWLYIQWLWIDEAFRGRGIADNLLSRAEAEAKRRGCLGAYIDTFSDQALRLYQRHGYRIFGEIPDFVDSRTRSFLCKRWSQ
jgi:ribosomal protein S18 acetylase RimI-like enzyme